jgi:glycosyltransferase 2 family protein
MSRRSGKLGKGLLASAGLAVSAIFLWLAVRNADLDAVRKELEAASLGLIFVAVVVLGLGYGFQAARWKRIADTPTLGLGRFYGMVLSGLACNNVLPIRIGELVRARMLSQDAPMAGGRALGTVALDRACDVVTLALLLTIGLQAVASPSWLVQLVIGVLVALVVLAGALVFARLYTARRKRERHARSRGRQLVRDTLDMLAEPIGRRRAALWLGLSLCTWTLGSVAVNLVARSVGIELAPAETVFVAAALSLGVAIPSSPGYVGTYQWLGVASLGLLDVPVNEALAFTILMQACWYVPTTIAGGAFLGIRALRSHAVDPGSDPWGPTPCDPLLSGVKMPPAQADTLLS